MIVRATARSSCLDSDADRKTDYGLHLTLVLKHDCVLYFAGCLKIFKEQLTWAIDYEHNSAFLHVLKEIGSLIFWMSLLDTAMVRSSRFDPSQECQFMNDMAF